MLHISDGGYLETLGYTGNPKDKPTVVPVPEAEADAIEPEKDDADFDTQVGKYISLKQHSVDVESEVRELCAKLVNYNLPTDILARSGRWHDLGKAHKVFQEMLTPNQPDNRTGEIWAKSDDTNKGKSKRPGFRHELV
ncbi:MAG: HD domain-containing protein, partial [Nostoc sp.]